MTTTEQGIVQVGTNIGLLASLSPEELKIIRAQLAVNCTDDEIAYGLMVAKTLELSVFDRQLYMIKYGGSTPKMALIIGVGGYRAIAAREQDARGYQTYAGSDPAVFGARVSDPDTKLGWHPESATVTVFKMIGPNRIPFTATVYWEGRAQYQYNKPRERWAIDPRGMLEKCAEVAALRKAFPFKMAKLARYDADEDGIAAEYRVTDAEPAPQPQVTAPPPAAAPQPAPEPKQAASLPPSVAHFMDVCPMHDVAWRRGTVRQTGQAFYRHGTGTYTEGKATKPDGTKEQKEVFCYRKKAFDDYLAKIGAESPLSPMEQASIIRDHLGASAADLGEEDTLRAIALITTFPAATSTPAPADSEPDPFADLDEELAGENNA